MKFSKSSACAGPGFSAARYPYRNEQNGGKEQRMTHHDGDTSAGDTTIEQLYQTQRRALLAYLARLVGDRSAAEDLCQEAFLKALRGWSGRQAAAATTAWLYRIAANTAYDHLRRQRAALARLPHAAEPASTFAPEARLDTAERVRAALASLPAGYRAVLVLHICQGYGLDEIAAAAGCSHGALKMRLSRARARFQQAYRA
jgi:RNA polymerase sigma-70 factor (ECF subfamily)